MRKFIRRMQVGMLTRAMTEFPADVRRDLGLFSRDDIRRRAEELID